MMTSFEGIFLLLTLISSFFYSTSSQCTSSDSCVTTGTKKNGWLVYDMYTLTQPATEPFPTNNNCPISQWSQRQVLPLGKCLKIGWEYKVYSMNMGTDNLPENVYTERWLNNNTVGCTGPSDMSSEEYGQPTAYTACSSLSSNPDEDNAALVVYSFGIVSYAPNSSANTWPGPPEGVMPMNYMTAHLHSATECAGTVDTVLYIFMPSDPSFVCSQSECSNDFNLGAYGSGNASIGICPPRSTLGGGCTSGVCKTAGYRGYLARDMYADLSTCSNDGPLLSRYFSPGGSCEAKDATMGEWVVKSIVPGSGSLTAYSEIYKSNTCTKSSFSSVSGFLMDTNCQIMGNNAMKTTATEKIGIPQTGGPYVMRTVFRSGCANTFANVLSVSVDPAPNGACQAQPCNPYPTPTSAFTPSPASTGTSNFYQIDCPLNGAQIGGAPALPATVRWSGKKAWAKVFCRKWIPQGPHKYLCETFEKH